MDGDVGSIGYSTQQHTWRRRRSRMELRAVRERRDGREMMSSSAVDGEGMGHASTRGLGPRSEVGIVFSSTQLQVIHR